MSKTAKKKNTSQTGDLGEKIAIKYLKSLGFSILDTKFLKKWGELDIVAKNNGIVHCIEVKTFTYADQIELNIAYENSSYRPEELVDDRKLKQIKKASESWISEHGWDGEVQVDVVGVRMVTSEKYAVVNHIAKVLGI